MKRLLAFVMVTLLSFPVFAENDQFQLNIQNNVVIHEDSDWEILMHENVYNFFVSKQIKQLDKDSFMIYSFIQFDMPYTYSSFNEPTDKIYTLGVMSCSRKAFMLLRQVYVKKGGEIQFIQPFQPNEYVSEVETIGTARNQMYLKTCSGETV